MSRRVQSFVIAAFLASIIVQSALAASPEEFRGGLWTHDPSTVVRCNNEYWVFSTGRGILSRRSSDLATWQAGPRVFTNPPSWTTSAVPNNRGNFWAPDVIEVSNRFLLYYSVSTWGSQNSAIGLVVNATLDPGAANFHWSDSGMVIQSSPKENFNTIDPSVMLDSHNRLWLAFGSFWTGIKLVELNPASGLLLQTNGPVYPLAWKNAIEASCLHERGGYYYLLVNWGQCCRGTNSTYNIRIGRSRDATGPYLDKDGVDMLKGGGTLLLGSSGRFIGPGHAGFLAGQGSDRFSFHFYDGDRQGAATLEVRKLEWDAQGWPVVLEK